MRYPLIRALTIVTNHTLTPPSAADRLGCALEASARLITCSSRVGVERVTEDACPTRTTII